MKKTSIMLLVVFFMGTGATAVSQPPEGILQAIALLDYIADDYPMAVSESGGVVINQMEYEEMREFVLLITQYLTTFESPPDKTVESFLNQLRNDVMGKKNVSSVRQGAYQLKDKLIQTFFVPVAPHQLPDLERGRELYDQSCSDCHGSDGRAQTEKARNLEIPPTAFAEIETLNRLSPFQAFNTITYGIDGTPMPSSAELSEEDRWALAVYLFQFRPEKFPPDDVLPRIPWRESMSLSDGEILEQLKKDGLNTEQALNNLGQIRSLAYDASITQNQPILFAIDLARLSLESFKAGEYEKSLDQAVRSYLDGFEIVETVLSSKGHHQLVFDIEKKFLAFRQGIRSQDPHTIKLGSELVGLLQDAASKLKETASYSTAFSFFSSLTIIFREGLEAILLLAVIFSALSSLGDRHLKKWVHFSWMLALLAGGLTWMIAQNIITGARREGIEGWMSLIAAAVLIYVSFWIFSKRDTERWKQFLLGKIRGKKRLGLWTLCLVSFLAVYREVFETILFIQALKIQVTHHVMSLNLGSMAAILLLGATTWLIFTIGKHVPLNLFFGASSLLLSGLAIVFAGQGIHSLQEASLIPQTPISFFTLPIIGLYPTREGVGLQSGIATLFLLSLLWQQWIRRPRFESKLEAQMTHASVDLLNTHELGEHLLEHLKQLKKKLGKEKVSLGEMKEIIGHMQDLDNGIHRAILDLEQIQREGPRGIDEIFDEVQELQVNAEHEELVRRVHAFKTHVETLKKRRR